MVVKLTFDHNWTTKRSEYEAAAISILQLTKRPMTINELVEAMISNDLVTVRGKTPTKTLYALISRKEKRRIENRMPPLFEKIREGRSIKYRLFG